MRNKLIVADFRYFLDTGYEQYFIHSQTGLAYRSYVDITFRHSYYTLKAGSIVFSRVSGRRYTILSINLVYINYDKHKVLITLMDNNLYDRLTIDMREFIVDFTTIKTNKIKYKRRQLPKKEGLIKRIIKRIIRRNKMLIAKIDTKDLLVRVEDTEDENYGDLHTDGVAFQENINRVEIKDIVYETSEYSVLETNNGTYINSKWVEYFKVGSTKVTPLKSPKRLSDVYLHLGRNKLYNKETKELINKDELKLCTKCGNPEYRDGLCQEHFIEKHLNIRNYSYKPTPEFQGEQIKKDKDHPIWYGIELEYGCATKDKLAELHYLNPDKIYFKADSSIKGTIRAECVSHPHSFTSLMSNDSYINSLGILDVDYTGDANGCHIHISRTAFKDNRHYSLFYFLIHSDNELLQAVAGRKFTNYCKPLPTGKVYTKKCAVGGEDRSVAVNETNSATVEIRVFNSTNKPEQVKRYIQFLDSLIKYTRYHSKRVSLDRWAKYVEKYKGKYAELYSFLREYGINKLNGSVVYKEPKVVLRKLDQVKPKEFTDIVGIIHKDGSDYPFDRQIVGLSYEHINDKVKFHIKGTSSTYNFKLKDVKFVKLMKE